MIAIIPNADLARMLAQTSSKLIVRVPSIMLQASSGDVAGVGVSLSTDNERDLPLIVGVESGTPAAEAGLKVFVP